MITAEEARALFAVRGRPCLFDQMYTYTVGDIERAERTVAIVDVGNHWQGVNRARDGRWFDTTQYSSKAALVRALTEGTAVWLPTTVEMGE